jgi:hypothetical protein
VLECDRRVDVQRRRRELDVALLVVELDLERVVGDLLDAAELVDEVHVPGGAPELAVGRAAQADRLLVGDPLADGVVLDCAQLVGVDPSRGVVLTRLQQRLGRSRLPTWSARNGGVVRAAMAVQKSSWAGSPT